MVLDAITCCVGKEYFDYLSKHIDKWLCYGVDSLTIVTTEGDQAEQFAVWDKVKVVTTDVFTKYGAHFNKGAALNYAYNVSNPSDWVLHFDADIEPPTAFDRVVRLIMKHPRQGKDALYGARRYDTKGKPLDEPAFCPFGFFQMFHCQAPAALKWPIFEAHHGHAGNYDNDFLHRWNKSQWIDTGLAVTHHGEPRTNWFGLTEDDVRKMIALKEQGLFHVWKKSQDPTEQLVIPKPTTMLEIARNDLAFAREVVRMCSNYGPFEMHARLGDKNRIVRI